MMLNAQENYLELVRGIDLRIFERVRKMPFAILLRERGGY